MSWSFPPHSGHFSGSTSGRVPITCNYDGQRKHKTILEDAPSSAATPPWWRRCASAPTPTSRPALRPPRTCRWRPGPRPRPAGQQGGLGGAAAERAASGPRERGGTDARDGAAGAPGWPGGGRALPRRGENRPPEGRGRREGEAKRWRHRRDRWRRRRRAGRPHPRRPPRRSCGRREPLALLRRLSLGAPATSEA
jgi:hypothetical protein